MSDVSSATSAGVFVTLGACEECKEAKESFGSTNEKQLRHRHCQTVLIDNGGSPRKLSASKLRVVDLGWIQNWLKTKLPDLRETARKSIEALDPGPMPREPERPTGEEGNWTAQSRDEYRAAMSKFTMAIDRYNRMSDIFNRQIDRLVDKMDADTKSDRMDSVDAKRLMTEPEGSSVLLYLSCRQMHTELTFDYFDFMEKYDLAGMMEIVDLLGEINSPSEDAQDAGAAKNSSRGSHNRRRSKNRKLAG